MTAALGRLSHYRSPATQIPALEHSHAADADRPAVPTPSASHGPGIGPQCCTSYGRRAGAGCRTPGRSGRWPSQVALPYDSHGSIALSHRHAARWGPLARISEAALGGYPQRAPPATAVFPDLVRDTGAAVQGSTSSPACAPWDEARALATFQAVVCDHRA